MKNCNQSFFDMTYEDLVCLADFYGFELKSEDSNPDLLLIALRRMERPFSGEARGKFSTWSRRQQKRYYEYCQMLYRGTRGEHSYYGRRLRELASAIKPLSGDAF